MDAYIEARHEDERSRRRRRFLLFILVMGLAMSSFGASTFSLAIFTDTATVTNNAFTTGSIDITASPASAAIGFTGMMPGDSVAGSLTIQNAGAAQLRYAMTSASTNTDTKNLRDAIALEIRTEGTGCATFDGTVLYSSSLGAAAFGSVAAGNQAGDRTLNGGVSEVLCLRASLASGTASSYQAAATTATFTFDAEQTANNP
jgi:hypothetical protein